MRRESRGDSPSAKPTAEAHDPKVPAREDRERRALEQPLDFRLDATAHYPLLQVRNPIRKTHYLVMLPAFPDRIGALCTCPDFARRGLGTCKHIEAGLRWLTRSGIEPREVPDPEEGRISDAIWQKIDRRLRILGSASEISAQRVRVPGAALYDSDG